MRIWSTIFRRQERQRKDAPDIDAMHAEVVCNITDADIRCSRQMLQIEVGSSEQADQLRIGGAMLTLAVNHQPHLVSAPLDGDGKFDRPERIEVLLVIASDATPVTGRPAASPQALMP